MDTTRDKEIDKQIKTAFGDALRQLRLSNGLSLAVAAKMTGKTPERLSEIEDGQKNINLCHFFQLVATYGGSVTLEGRNLSIPIIGVKPFTPEQVAIFRQQREQNRMKEESIKKRTK